MMILRRSLRILADLRLAIVLLLAIALFSISGTVIEQGQSIGYYQSNYPEHPALFGFLTWRVIGLLGLDHVYRTPWFLALLVLLAASLTACSYLRQWPALKTARRWNYYDQPKAFEKLALSAELSSGSLTTLAPLLTAKGYTLFQEDHRLYARKGLIGKIGPIVVHVSMLLILAGAVWGSLSGFFAQEVIPSGAQRGITNVIDAGPFSASQIPHDWEIKVNRFWIDYTAEGNIDQFYSDLSVVDQEGTERDRQTISVNHPLRHRGVTLYQTNWGIDGVQVRVNNSPIFQLPMAPLKTGSSGRFWGTWVPTKPDMSTGVSLVARDLQGLLLVYGQDGNPLGAVREGTALQLDEDLRLSVVKVIGSTGLQIKADPGVPLVYAGFGLLMVGVVMSYVSHSQIWALQAGDRFFIGGKTNRSHILFERELVSIIESLEPTPAPSDPQPTATVS
ncbi:cytochrome c biogenesis protein [Spirulina major]|uniref:cytochrome c biogenesis protein n=1 Tax=Spirulina major TaxID=270636 RepID=UPI000934CFEB|nr:cytochrome c biogenesis protein [Spirulina major]